MPYIIGRDATLLTPLPSYLAMAASFVGMQLVGDFGLYWGHRIQHTVPRLWELHRIHHRLETPTPMSTIFIHPVDATLQGGLPILLAAAAIRPHPILFYLYVWLRVAENVVNHSGLDGSFIVSLLTLKFLPFRASIAHHDYQ